MKFFHVYNEDYFEGLVKNNLINQDSGFKIQHVFSLSDAMKFNSIAAKGGKLHRLISEGKYPFYVDRIAGGVTYHEYSFDRELAAEYENLLGDWFLGFQLHESASNRRTDWKNLLMLMQGDHGPYNYSELFERSLSKYAVTDSGERLNCFSQGTPQMYAKMQLAETKEEYISEIRDMFMRYMRETSGFILPCDSYYMFSRMQLELGMRTLMPEAGCQIPQMRIAAALARGLTKAKKKTWGIYYETWIATLENNDRKNPVYRYSMPCYNTESGNEWHLTQELHPDDFTSFGENGGSSRYLQNRIYYYTLMSGADYIAEEWGLNCSYCDMRTFELSPYGIAKKEFIDFSHDMRDVKADIPFAIVLPREYECVQLPDICEDYEILNHREKYMGISLTPAEKARIGHTEDVLKLIFARCGKVYGNEGHVLTNSRFGDLFDIIYEDASHEVLSKYTMLADASCDGHFAKKNRGMYRVLESRDLAQLEHDIKECEKELFCRVDNMHWINSKAGNGRRFITIFNNEGNIRSAETGDTLIPEAAASATITFKAPVHPKCIKTGADGVSLRRISDTEYRAVLPPAGFAIIEY